jgi:acetyl-CoA acetyltransferase
MRPKSIAIVGAAESTRLGVIPDMSQIQLHADAALNAMADAGLKPADIDGIATAGETPVTVAHYLGLTPKWVDGTAVGGCSFMIHVRHAAAAIASGLCETVLITHGESGRSGIGRTRNVVAPTSLAGQFEQPYGPMGPPTLFTIPVLRYMKTYGLTHETLAMVSVVQREWAAKNPRATFKTPITVEDVLNSRMIAYPFRLLQCCLVTDGGGALILVAAERAKDFPQKRSTSSAPARASRRRWSAKWKISPPRAPSASPPQGLRRGRHHARRRRPSDDLRRLRPSANLRPR